MKATLEFNLPEDQSEYDMAINGQKFYTVIWDMKQHLRGKVKHGDLPEGEHKAYDEMYDYFCGLIHSEDVGGQF
jgi:hypothetical protein